MIIWIEKTLALAIHERQLAEHGGNPALRDETLLDSPSPGRSNCRPTATRPPTLPTSS